MKVERWEEESDEDWAERLAEEIEFANSTETTKYFVERDKMDEDAIIINYVGGDRWMWKEHPEGPFTCKQILEWKRCHDVVVPTLQIKIIGFLTEMRELQSSTQSTIKGVNG